MNLNKRILRAINKGVSTALTLNNPELQSIIKKSSELISKDAKRNTEKILYSRMLQERLPDPMDVDEKFIEDALELHRAYGILYNPHLDGKEFKNFILKCIEIQGDEANLNWIDVSNVTNMWCLFYKLLFNGDISEWDVSNVTNMSCMFWDSSFNGDISRWDVYNVVDMNCMFLKSKFNGDISRWDVVNVKNMQNMFAWSQFNKDISRWDTTGVTNMKYMFANSQFNQDISSWDISNVTNKNCMFYDCQISEENKPKFNI